MSITVTPSDEGTIVDLVSSAGISIDVDRGATGLKGDTGEIGADGLEYNKYTESITEPTVKNLGDEWLNLNTGILYKYISDSEDAYWFDVTGMNLYTSAVSSVTITTSTTTDNVYDIIFIDATLNDVIVTLGSASLLSKRITLKRIDSTSNIVTINGIIDGVSVSTIDSFESIDLVSSGTKFYIV